MVAPLQVTFDCADPGWPAGFWREALSDELERPPPSTGCWCHQHPPAPPGVMAF